MNNMSGRLEKETIFYDAMDKKLGSLPRILSEYYTSMRANRKSYTTIEVYINNVLHLARFLFKDNISEDFYKHIGSSDIESYMISLETRRTSTGIKRTGDDILQSRWSSLNTFFSWLVKRGRIEKNPMELVDRPKNNTEHKVTYLTKTEINKLLKAIDDNKNTVVAARDKMVVSLALATALRVGALTSINIEDIDFENSVIKVIEKRQKIREIPIGDNIKKSLREWIEIRNVSYADIDTNALFLSQKKTRLSDDAVSDFLDKYCATAGIKRITPHKLRASAATNLAAAKVDIQTIGNILGHKSTGTTLKYVAVLEENKKNAVNILDRLV